MAGLLVSVRSAAEAVAAVAGGASVIDVKEPDRGPLGRADVSVWREVRAVVPASIPVSVALGELADWVRFAPTAAPEKPVDWLRFAPAIAPENRADWVRFAPAIAPEDRADWIRFAPTTADFARVSYRKIGLAGTGPDWARHWGSVRQSLGPGPAWVAVTYSDHDCCAAPEPDEILEVALAAPDCLGLLVDTWDKSRPGPIDLSWSPWVRRAQASGRFVALAGGLDEAALLRLAPLAPDLFAVRGAACRGGERRGTVDPSRVQRLARAAAQVIPRDHTFPAAGPSTIVRGGWPDGRGGPTVYLGSGV